MSDRRTRDRAADPQAQPHRLDDSGHPDRRRRRLGRDRAIVGRRDRARHSSWSNRTSRRCSIRPAASSARFSSRKAARSRRARWSMRLDETVPRATLGIVRSQLDELMARQTRLLAERDGADAITFPAELLRRRRRPRIATAMAGEEKLFECAPQCPRSASARSCASGRADQRRDPRPVGPTRRPRQSEIELIGRGARGRDRALREEPGQHHALHGAAARPGETAKASTASSAPTSPAPAAGSAKPSCRSSSSTRISAPKC